METWSPNAASPQLLPAACSEHHGTTVHAAQRDQRKSAGTGGWGPLQLALSHDNKQHPYRAMTGGPAPRLSSMLGMT